MAANIAFYMTMQNLFFCAWFLVANVAPVVASLENLSATADTCRKDQQGSCVQNELDTIPGDFGTLAATNFVYRLSAVAQRHPDKAAFQFFPSNFKKDEHGDALPETISFGDLEKYSNYVAQVFKDAGISNGSVVLLVLSLSRTLLIIVYALFKIGAIMIAPPTAAPPTLQNLFAAFGTLVGIRAAIFDLKPDVFIGSSFTKKVQRLLKPAHSTIKTVVRVRDGLFLPERWEGAKFIRKTEGRLTKLLDPLGDTLLSVVDWFKGASTNVTRTTMSELLERFQGQRSFEIEAKDWRPLPVIFMFTTGSTGPAKPVIYTHRMLLALASSLQTPLMSLNEADVDYGVSGAFIVHPVLGMTTVLDGTKPLMLDPEARVRALRKFGATSMFLSPTTARKIARYGISIGSTGRSLLPKMRAVIMGGENVGHADLVALQNMISDRGKVVSVYGATEGFPLAIIDTVEVVNETGSLALEGKGFCVGPAFGDVKVQILPSRSDGHHVSVPSLTNMTVGELVFAGSPVSPSYAGKLRDILNEKNKIQAHGFVWHRTGDMGYLDWKQRIWILGREKHAVRSTFNGKQGIAEAQTLFPNQVEPVFNEHVAVSRSALVGIGKAPEQTPVIIVERIDNVAFRGIAWETLQEELQQLAKSSNNEAAQKITRFLLWPGAFPVDPRHQSKIERPKLAEWAHEQISNLHG